MNFYREYKLIDTNDSIDFGHLKNEPFKWIYLLNTSYLEWLINETDICFNDLKLFYTFGKPLIVDSISLNDYQTKSIIELTRSLGKNLYSKGSKKYKITVDIYAKSIENGIISSGQFIERDFVFDETTIISNNSKLLNSKPHFHSVNSLRDKQLSNIFNKLTI
jgi:hypothetical protein